MKRIILALLSTATLFAFDGRKVVLTASAPLPSVYTKSSPSLILSEIGAYNNNIIFFSSVNNVACTITQVAGSDNTAPATILQGNQKEVYLFASQPMQLYLSGSEQNIYCRASQGGALTAGEIAVLAY